MRPPLKKTASLLASLFVFLAACAEDSNSGSSGGGNTSGAPSFTLGGDLVMDEDTIISQASWATEIQNGALFVLSPVDPSLFLETPTINGFGGLTLIPAENKSGNTTVSVTLQSAEGLATPPATFQVTINPVNDPPSFDVGEDITVEAASGTHLFEGWASNITAGPLDEAAQEVSFVIESNSAPELFGAPPVLFSPNGNLSFNLAEGAVGEATIELSLVDNGDVEGLGANNSSGPSAFTLSVVDTTRPSAQILYPPTGSLTDASEINLFGTADDAVEIGFVRLNGLYADTTDGYKNWSREDVSLGPSSVITAQVSDTSGNFEGNADTVEISGGQRLPINPSALAFDHSQGRLIFYSTLYGALFSYFPATGEVILFSEPSDGSTWEIKDLAYSSSPPGLYALEGETKSVLAFNLNTGEKSVISSAGRGTGPSFDQPMRLAFVNGASGSPPSLAVSDRKFGPDDSPAIVSVSIGTGNRTVISSSAEDDPLIGRGDGPEMNSPAGLHYQKSLSRFLVLNTESKTLLSVDQNTGDRAVIISNDDAEDGVMMFAPSDVALSSSGAMAWILDPVGKKIFAAQLESSTLSLLCSNNTQTGADGHRWSSPRNFTYKAGTGLFVSDYPGHAVYSVSTSSGSRTLELSMTAGSGPSWGTPNKLAIDELRDVGFLSCSSNDAIYAVSLLNGERTLLSGAGAGSGLSLFDPAGVAVLSATTLVAIDTGAGQPRVIKISRPGGARSLVSGQGVGGGVSFNDASSVAVNASANAAYVLDLLDKTITSVNLSTGDRYRVAGGGVGAGPALGDVASIAWHKGTSRLLVLQPGAVLSIDPVFLQRDLLCDLDLAGLAVDEQSWIACPLDVDYALVSSSSPLSVTQISTVTGSAVTISDLSSVAGPPIDDISGLGYSSARKTLYLFNSSLNALHAVNAPLNEQVIFSRD